MVYLPPQANIVRTPFDYPSPMAYTGSVAARSHGWLSSASGGRIVDSCHGSALALSVISEH